ncbi:MAG: hypothetical protein K2X57_18280 [Xanthobacteraceae bacterium]|nr:hypothetical protein [Xanthobacteraceae bacterium]
MNTPCPFDTNQMGFSGTPVQQAQCLLRFVKRVGNVDDTPATLPQILTTLLSDPLTLGVTKSQLRAHLQKQGIAESTVGGPVTDRVCHADSDNPSAPLARYFMIHDTSSKLKANETFDPAFINTAAWSGNSLSSLKRGKTHIYITRLGQTLTDNSYLTPFRATQFELKPPHTRFRGLFLHHELVQPRKGPGGTDPDSPDPGFTPEQYAGLALQYVIASVRRGNWMVPAFHCVLDLHVGDHDDPQRFDLAAWGNALDQTLIAVRTQRNAAPSMAMEVMAAPNDFRTPAGRSKTKDGKGGSTTTGLQGSIREPAPGVTVIDAVETITAFRDGRSLGAARAVRQVRTTNTEKTVVEQADYCWGRRSLPNAELVEAGQALTGSGVFEGKATFFGKGDTEDEGTGGPVFGTVQTDSSVFGISLKKARMLDLGLLTDKNGVLKLSDKGARAIVEVFFPDTGRLVRLPLVDIGPANTGPAKTAVADLTVAATAFLQRFTEKDIRKLDNIVVQARVIA